MRTISERSTSPAFPSHISGQIQAIQVVKLTSIRIKCRALCVYQTQSKQNLIFAGIFTD